MLFYGEFGGRINQMIIMTVGNHAAILKELVKELSEIFPGSEIIAETDALMAGKYAFNHEVDIVFAEADMKRMNGLQLIQFVRHKHPDVKSFLIGTDEDLSGFLGVVSEDVTGILTYPFMKKTIQDTLRKNGL